MRSIPPVSSRLFGEVVEVDRRRAELACRAAPGPGSAGARGSAPGGRARARRRGSGTTRATASASVPWRLDQAAERRAPRRRGRRSSGVPWSAKPSRSAISGRSSREEVRQQLDAAADVVAALGGGLRRSRWPARRSRRTRSRSRASGPSTASEFARQPGQLAVLVGEDREHLVGLAQRRVGAVDDLVELLAAAGQAGAELAQQDREALPVGQPQDVVDQVEVDRRARVLDRQQALALAVALLDPAQLGRVGRAGLALDELLADQRPAAGSCRRRPP